jgi:ribosomal protein L24
VKKADGTDVEKPVHPSNVQVLEIHEDDKKRRESLSIRKEEEE